MRVAHPLVRAAARIVSTHGLAILLGVYGAAIALAPGFPAKATLCVPLVIVPLIGWLFAGSHRWLMLFFGAAWLLPPLPIAFGNSGPHVAVLVAAVGVWIGFLRFTEWHVDFSAPSLAIAALLAILLASVAFAAVYSGVEVAAASLARVLLFGIAAYVYFYVRSGPAPFTLRSTARLAEDEVRQGLQSAWLRSRESRFETGLQDRILPHFTSREHLIRILFACAVASALFACVDFYFQFPAPAGYGAQFVWLDTGVFRRAQGIFYEASTLGNFCVFFLDFVLAALLYRRRVRILPMWILLAGAAVLGTALILSYSRASLVSLAVAVGVLVWLNRDRISYTRWIGGLAAFGAAGIAIATWLLPNFLRLYWLRIFASFQYFFDSPDAILSGRLRSWDVLRDFLLNHPWHALAGIGYKTLPYSDFIGGTAIADNTYLSMLVETGVLGLAALLALHLAILSGGYRAARSGDPMRALLGTWILCFWAGEIIQMFSGELLTYWRVLPAYFCVFALATRTRETLE